ncbi:hypothetical protein H0E87_020790 [Populus deltoides]|uniref:Splicing factor YJU2 n=1 Tax=Populus deltoides TaxID=3696 RepID=A0A8T2XM11_POPDE|nr:hypothetical protein H0E87_020790 [Populus deltoides]
MGERKVLNKYYPPDFDPSKLPRIRRPKNQQIKVRMMLPMSIRCNTCGNYIYKGTKFNSRKEDVIGESKVVPRGILNLGVPRMRNWTLRRKKRDAEEMGDAMKSLENRTLDSKREIDILAALDEMKSMKSRHATVSVDAMLEALQRTASEKERKLEEEDEALIKSLFKQRQTEVIRRISDEDSDDDEDFNMSSDKLKKRKVADEVSSKPTDSLAKASVSDSSNNSGESDIHVPWLSTENSSASGTQNDGKPKFRSPLIRISVKKKPVAVSDRNKPEENKQVEQSTANDPSIGLQSLCQNYDSDDEDD